MFVHLHGYSTYSFLEAIGKPKDIVKNAKSLWSTAIWLTDLNVVYGAFQHYMAGKDEGIKPIVGVEIGFALDANNVANLKSVGSITLLAMSTEWYHNLLQLVTYASQTGIEFRPKVDMKALTENKTWILAFSWGVESRISKMILNWEPLSKIQEIIGMLKNTLWTEDFYLEIIAQDEQEHPDIAKINKTILELAELTQTPCIISNIYAYPRPTDKINQELAMAIKDNLKLFDPNHRVPTTENHLMTEEEIRSIALKNGYSPQQVEERIQNTGIIADRVDFKIEMGTSLFPKYDGEEELEILYQAWKEKMILDE